MNSVFEFVLTCYNCNKKAHRGDGPFEDLC